MRSTEADRRALRIYVQMMDTRSAYRAGRLTRDDIEREAQRFAALVSTQDRPVRERVDALVQDELEAR